MAKQIKGVYEEVLLCAKREFLAKGFKDSSLRTIAQAAGTSTGSIYTRFKSKEGLFQAVVGPVVEGLTGWFSDMQESFHQRDQAEQKQQMYSYTQSNMAVFVEYVYDHFDVFRILLTGADGTEYVNFVNDLVEIELDYTIKFMEFTENEYLQNGEADRDFLHIINSMYYTGIFEVVLHNMKKEDGIRYAKKLSEFHYAGFERLFHMTLE